MSRSSLARQEKLRQKGKLTEAPLVEEVKDRKNMVPMECDVNFNINALLIENIKSSRYFQSLNETTEVHAVVDQIYYKATNAEPWMPGAARSPTPFFCLLYKLLLLKVTGKQMRMLLTHVDSPYIRAIGFVYLRYTCPAAEIWDWIEPYINDTEEFAPGHNPNVKTTIGAFVQSLISEQKYSSTIFPRIPQTLQRQLMVKILRKKEEAERAEKNKSLIGRVVVGMKLRAVYSTDQQWYDARVDVVNDADGTFTVTFLPEDEYGNQEVVNIGQLDLSASLGVTTTSVSGGAGKEKSRSSRRKSRSVSRSRSPAGRGDRRRSDEDDRRSSKRRSPSRSNSRRRTRERSSSRSHRASRDRDSKRRWSPSRHGRGRNSRSPSRSKGQRGRDDRDRRGHSRDNGRARDRRNDRDRGDGRHGRRAGDRCRESSRDRDGRRDRDRRSSRDRERRSSRDRVRRSSRDRDRRSSRDRVRERGGSRRRHASRSVSPRRSRGGDADASVASVGAVVRATDDELLQLVLEKERNKHATSGRNYAKGHIAGIRGSMALDYGFNLNAGDNNLDVGIVSSRSVSDVASKAKKRQEEEARAKSESEQRNGKRQAGLDRLKQIYGDASAVVKPDDDE